MMAMMVRVVRGASFIRIPFILIVVTIIRSDKKKRKRNFNKFGLLLS